MPDITELLEATTPTDLPPLDVTGLSRRARRRGRRHRVAAVAGVTAVVLAAAVALPRTGAEHDDVVTRPSEQQVDTWLIGVDPDVDIVVFLRQDITERQRDGLVDYIQNYPGVTSTEYWDDEDTMREFRRVFADNPAMLEEGKKNPDLAPNSLRIMMADHAPADEVVALVRQLEGSPSVLRVVRTEEHQQPATPYDYELVLHLDVGVTPDQRADLLAALGADDRVEDVRPGNLRQSLDDSTTYVVALADEPGLDEVAAIGADLMLLAGVREVSAQ